MDLIRKAIDKLTGKNTPKTPPLIMTPWGAVSESARKQAAENMRADPAVRARVIQVLADQQFAGDLVAAEKEARLRYPESWGGDDDL